jgi:hypothetical protein
VRLSWRRRLSVYAGLGTLAIALMSAIGASPASADQTISHTFPQVDCTASLLGTTIHQKQDITVGFVVPDSVSPGETFTVTFPGGSALLPSTGSGFPITAYSNLSLTYQIKGTTFKAGSISNPGTATLAPTAGGATQNVVETSTLTAPDKIANGNPGPFPPGTLTTPTITVQAVAPASGAVTLNAFQLTTTVTLAAGGGVSAAVTCAIPTDTLVTIPVVAGATTTTAPAGTTTTTAPAGTTTTTAPAGTTTTTAPAGTTTTTAPAGSTTTVPATTTTVPQTVQGEVFGTGTNVNPCTTKLNPSLAPLIVDSPTTVTITISSKASPQPHLGQTITLSDTSVTVSVPPTLLKIGYEKGVLTNGEVIPSTLTLVVGATNATPATRSFVKKASPKLVVNDPTPSDPANGDETIAALTVTSALPSTTWTPTSNTADVIFSEKSATIVAGLTIGGTAFTDTITCAPHAPANSFVAVGATGSVTTTTNAGVGVQAVTTTTAAPAAGTLPFTGSKNVALWLVLAAICLDAGIVLMVGTKRRAAHLFNRN